MAPAMYCVRCHRPTPTTNARRAGSPLHPRVIGTCAVCGARKSQFIRKSGGSRKGGRIRGRGVGRPRGNGSF
jgi:RNase P subunit RPR2